MALPKRRRRGIFVEPQNKTLIRPAASRTSAWHLSHPMGEGHSPVGAAYSGSIPDDVALGRSLIYLHGWFYKYASPTDFAAFAFFARQKFQPPFASFVHPSHLPGDVAPTELLPLGWRFYKYASPTGLEKSRFRPLGSAKYGDHLPIPVLRRLPKGGYCLFTVQHLSK